MNKKPKVLYVVHNHPRLSPGGAEIHALELYEQVRAQGTFEPLLLARRQLEALPGGIHPGAPIAPAGEDDPAQYYFYTDSRSFDWFLGRSSDRFTVAAFRDFLLAHRPEVVHFQHTSGLGYDLVREARNTLPDAAIFYTLHEYLPICHRNGQMLRARTDQLCESSSPLRCHECFPEHSPQAFFLRKKLIQAQLAQVDQFISPSEFLKQRFVSWGIPEEKILVHENGREDAVPRVEPADRRRRNRFAFFGQLNPFKGPLVFLEALELLEEEARGARKKSAGIDAFLYGANLEIQSEAFQQSFREKLERAGSRTRMMGPYARARLPELMRSVDWVVIPSIWWENSPLVIQEAFLHGRPVICSDIGGMAEKVEDGVNGLHFRVGDPRSLASVIRKAADTEGLWQTLRAGIPPVPRMKDSARTLAQRYLEVHARRQPASEATRRDARIVAM